MADLAAKEAARNIDEACDATHEKRTKTTDNFVT
jgi:hypothetical protein